MKIIRKKAIKIYFLSALCFCLHVCKGITCVLGAQRGQKRITGNEVIDGYESSFRFWEAILHFLPHEKMFLTNEPSLQSPHYCGFYTVLIYKVHVKQINLVFFENLRIDNLKLKGDIIGVSHMNYLGEY